MATDEAIPRGMIEYKDIDGRPVSLDRLCRDEPAWSANNIRRLEAECERLREASRALLTAVDEKWSGQDTARPANRLRALLSKGGQQ